MPGDAHIDELTTMKCGSLPDAHEAHLSSYLSCSPASMTRYLSCHKCARLILEIVPDAADSTSVYAWMHSRHCRPADMKKDLDSAYCGLASSLTLPSSLSPHTLPDPWRLGFEIEESMTPARVLPQQRNAALD